MFLCYSNEAHMSYLGWENEALPLGNGKIGAKVFGGSECELIHFNEKTLWSGGKDVKGYCEGIKNADKGKTFREIQQVLQSGDNAKAQSMMKNLEGDMTGFGAYQSFGNLYMQFPKYEEVTKYIRDLDFDSASAMVTYKVKNTVFTRHYFVSYPDNVFVARIEAEQIVREPEENPTPNKKGAKEPEKVEPIYVNMDAYFVSDQKGKPRVEGDTIYLEGNVTANLGLDSEEGADANSMKYGCAIRFITDEQGEITAEDGQIKIRNANSVVIVMSISTNYVNNYPDFFSDEDPLEKAKLTVEKASQMSFSELYKRHLADYKALYERISFTLGEEQKAFSSDYMLKRFEKKGEFKRNIITTLFQYARYLLIASSRGDTLPANLQGIWNGKNNPPWCCDYHFNVNVQMNYWGAYAANLSETAIPYIDFVDSLRKPGRVVANRTLGIGEDKPDGTPDYEKETGWLLHTMVTPLGFVGPGSDWQWGWSPANGAWAVQNTFDYYLFTLDKEMLRDKIYPAMQESALLWSQLLFEDKNSGRLVVSPGYSPEHGPVSAGITYDQSIIHNLYTDVIKAAEILENSGMADAVDRELIEKVKKQLPELKPFAVGKWGQLKEWYEEDSFPLRGFYNKKVQKKHRHLSHLLCLYPFNQIDGSDEKLVNAVLTSLEDRGKKSTGWALAMRLLCYARLGKGNDCDEIICNIMRKMILKNFFGTHPPFQIDGNFGLMAGICEMLLQSHTGKIKLLPALPDSWNNGEIKGLVARGNFVVDIEWKDGKLKKGAVLSNMGGECALMYDGKVILVEDEEGKEIQTAFENGVTKFNTEKGKKYIIS